MPHGAQPPVGVVLPVEQAVLGAGGHHAVRLIGALGHQIVDEHPDVPLVPPQNEGLPVQKLQGGIHPGHEALDGGLLVAGGAVELPGPIEARHPLVLQGGEQLGGIHAVVFDGVGRAGHLRPLQAGNGVEHLHLHVLRQGRGQALDVELFGVQPHGLHKELVPLLVGKAHHLVLDGGAVPGPDALDHPGEQGGAVQVGPDNGVGGGIGVGQPAHRPVLRRLRRLKGEGEHPLVPRLYLHLGEIHAAGVHPGGRTRLEPPQAQAQPFQALGQGEGGGQAVGAGGAGHIPHDGAAPQVGTRGHHHRPHPVHRPVCGAHGGDPAAFGIDIGDLRLLHPQALLLFQGVLHDLLVPPPVGLRPEGPHRRALAPVEQPVLDARPVGGPCHLSPQGVQLPHQVALARAADGRVTRHVAHRVQIDGEAQGVQPQPRRGQGGLDARVARADDGNIVTSCFVIHVCSFSLQSIQRAGQWKNRQIWLSGQM